VRCFRRVEGKIEVLGDSACPGEKPEEEKLCELRPCEGVDWVVSDWSGVSKNLLPNNMARITYGTPSPVEKLEVPKLYLQNKIKPM
jgi:hypothetical protein